MSRLIYRTLLSLSVLAILAGAAAAQDRPLSGDTGQKRPRVNQRRDLFRQLGLNPAQMRQIGQMNVRRRPLLEAAQLRFREANQRLDQAIYSDQLNEAEVQDRLKEVQLAQAELIRLRSMNELSIRKLLTPEQLVRFRVMRQKFEAMNEERGRQSVRTVQGLNTDPDRSQ